jgi:hypothetical protein
VLTQFSQQIANLRYKAENREELKNMINQLQNTYVEKFNLYDNMLKAQRVLATVSDANTKRVLGYIQGIINKALKTMFPNETYNITVEKKLYSNTIPHINVILTEVTPDGAVHNLDFALQSGDGMGQIVSFLFNLCLMRIREARPLVILDEVLKGFHPDAIPYIRTIIEIFAKGGFQFVMVEYDLNDLGREYEVIKENGVAKLILKDRESDLSFSTSEEPLMEQSQER